jgi:hypothetical protein
MPRHDFDHWLATGVLKPGIRVDEFHQGLIPHSLKV